MDSDASGFLAEVIASPDDDIPRLIYADFLEEQGSPRGEFIRVQCELNQINDLNPRWLDLHARSDQLLEQYGTQWADELEQDVRKCRYTRGFIETITILARSLLKNGDKLFRSVPVRWIRLNYLKGTADQWADCEALQHLRYLDLSDLKIPEADLLAFLSSSHLKNLRGIKIGGFEADISTAVATTLSQPRIAGALESLDFNGTEEATDRLLNAFRNSIGLPNLRHLQLGSDLSVDLSGFPMGMLEKLELNAYMTEQGMYQVSQLPIRNLSCLRILSARGSAIQPLCKAGVFESPTSVLLEVGAPNLASAEALFRDSNLRNCHQLNLAGFQAVFESAEGDQLAKLISEHAPLESLRTLKVAKLQPGQLARLLRSPYLQNLESLTLDQSVLGPQDFAALAAGNVWQSLRKLHLDRMCPPVEAWAELRTTRFPELLQLVVDRRFLFGVPEEEIESEILGLLRSDAFPALQSLTLSGLRLTATTLTTIAQSTTLSELRQFRFEDNHGTNEAMFSVLESPLLPRLKWFSVKGCRGLRRSAKILEKYGTRLRY